MYILEKEGTKHTKLRWNSETTKMHQLRLVTELWNGSGSQREIVKGLLSS